MRLTVYPEDCTLVLPVRPTDIVDDENLVPSFGEPEGSPPIEVVQVQPGEQDWSVHRNMVDLTGSLSVVKDLGVMHFPDIDLAVIRRAYERHSFMAHEFNSVRGETDWTMGFERGDWKVRTTTKMVLTSTPTDFHLYAELDAYEGEVRVASKSWSTRIPRDFI